MRAFLAEESFTKETNHTLTKHPTWSFNSSNQNRKWSGRPKSERKAFVHYQKCIAAANLSFLKDMTEGFTINFCCGFDPTGQVKVDVDKKMLRSLRKTSLDRSDLVIADIHHPPFRPLCCDTLLVDPPYSFYRGFKWILNLKDLARKKIILSHPGTNLKLHGFSRDLYFTNSKSIFLRLWWVYSKESQL